MSQALSPEFFRPGNSTNRLSNCFTTQVYEHNLEKPREKNTIMNINENQYSVGNVPNGPSMKLDDYSFNQIGDFLSNINNQYYSNNNVPDSLSSHLNENNNPNNNHLFLPGSSSSTSEYSTNNSYGGTPNSLDTPIPGSTEFFISNPTAILQPHNQQLSSQNSFGVELSSNGQLLPDMMDQQQHIQYIQQQHRLKLQQGHHMQMTRPQEQLEKHHQHHSKPQQQHNNLYFTPRAKSQQKFSHERNRSEISELASPYMSNNDYFNEVAYSPTHSSHDGINPLSVNMRGAGGNFDDAANFGRKHNSPYENTLGQILENQQLEAQQSPSDVKKNFLDFCDFVNFSEKESDSEKEELISDVPRRKVVENSNFKAHQNGNKLDLSSLGIEIKPTTNNDNNNSGNDNNNKNDGVNNFADMSFSINESFINEILNDGQSSAEQNTGVEGDLLKDLNKLDPIPLPNENENPTLLPAFQEHNYADRNVLVSEAEEENVFLDPNSLSNFKQHNMNRSSVPKLKKPNSNDAFEPSKSNLDSEKDPLDEGDTTIINNTSMMAFNESDFGNHNDSKCLPNTDNLIAELSSSDLTYKTRDIFTPTHSRNSSVNKFEMPKLKPFHQKSPKLGSPNRVTKFSHSTSFKSIPALNERLSFIDENTTMLNPDGNFSSPARRSLMASPTHSNFSFSGPESPTRESMYQQPMPPVLGSPMTSQHHQHHQHHLGAPMLGPGHGPVYFSSMPPFPQQTPPGSPTKAMNDLSLVSPVKGQYSPGKKNQFLLKPTPNGRKRIATSPRSKTGCWTCRIRHKKCDEGRPVCKNCAKISLKCDQFYDPKPSYMTNEEERKVKLAEIAHIWKNRNKKGKLLGDSNKSDSAAEETPVKVKQENNNLLTGDKENLKA